MGRKTRDDANALIEGLILDRGRNALERMRTFVAQDYRRAAFDNDEMDGMVRHIDAIESELRERRAQDLTSEELEALRFAQGDVVRAINPVADDGCQCEICCRRRRALATLSKLLTRGNR